MAVIQLLDNAQRSFSDVSDNPLLSRSPIFRNRELIDVAGESKIETFFVHTISRRVVTHRWRSVGISLRIFTDISET